MLVEWTVLQKGQKLADQLVALLDAVMVAR